MVDPKICRLTWLLATGNYPVQNDVKRRWIDLSREAASGDDPGSRGRFARKNYRSDKRGKAAARSALSLLAALCLSFFLPTKTPLFFFQPVVARRFSLVEARQAHDLLGQGGVSGKIVLVMNAALE